MDTIILVVITLSFQAVDDWLQLQSYLALLTIACATEKNGKVFVNGRCRWQSDRQINKCLLCAHSESSSSSLTAQLVSGEIRSKRNLLPVSNVRMQKVLEYRQTSSIEVRFAIKMRVLVPDAKEIAWIPHPLQACSRSREIHDYHCHNNSSLAKESQQDLVAERSKAPR